jgi:hypothetical protein
VAARPARGAGWPWGWVGVEAAVRSQPHQHRGGNVGEVQGELGGVVAGIEDDQGHRPASRQPAKQRTDLRGGGLVGVVGGMQPLGIYRGGPGVTGEADLGDPLGGPAGDDRLAGGVAGGVVVVAARRGAFGVAARPGGDIDREHQRVGGWQAADQQVAQPVGIDPTAGQRIVGAAPAAPTDRLQAQVRQRRQRRLGATQRVAQLEQRIGAAGEAGVQLAPEPAEPRQGKGWHRHGRAA